ncbi:fungal-specific transcription factor domain-containing protein [Aspergillus avenaceus]|uniref:Fungal-specific transcription factor domain-containing protein n=1 Tax=Aspergillus avenaceus TaxID=36643 RepID=A0A5N6TKD7_ASPAV|nr:fungal-specific transcription factor domain-containing protein [Aspergillus avenaceus]
MPPTRKNKPRRTHTLGGCQTCRRRHVKCDQLQPSCLTCQAFGVPCEGYSTEIRWMSSKTHSRVPHPKKRDAEKPAGKVHGTRRHLYTEKSRASMSTALTADLASSTVDALLLEVDSKSKEVECSSAGDAAVGPFGVLKLDPSVSTDHPQHVSSEKTSQEHDTGRPADEGLEVDPLLSSVTDPLLGADEFLHWADLFGLGSDLMSGLASGDLDQGGHGHNFYSSMCRSALDDVSHDAQDYTLSVYEIDSLPQQMGVDLVSPPSDILADSPFLLKHFQDNVIGQMMTLPVGQKSPWKILHIPTAVLTLSDLTYLGGQGLNHAKLANFYSLLACSAHHLSVNSNYESPHSAEHWKQITHHTYHRAKDHIQQSLKLEINGPKKAKYKDQLMAISAMAAFAILSGHQKDARCYMIDAERLMRLRGLSKREISRKARVLHHIYTWIRIVGESTYILHDYTPSAAFIEAFNHHFQPRDDALSQENCRRSGLDARLDDFLLMQPRQSDSDLDIDAPKEREVALQDIHLEDSRRWVDTLYSEIYGIPETWLSLVSQTTRLANVMDTLVVSGSLKKSMNPEAWEALQRRATRLENMICTFNSDRMRGGDEPSANPSGPHAHMLRALNTALVIFFYRRIRNVHPSILQSHVDEVIAALKDFDAALTQHQVPGPGTAWPAFMAGCEAIAPSKRDTLLRWIEKGGAQSGFAGFSIAKEVVTAVWKEQDGYFRFNRSGGPIPTWMDVLRQKKLWPMLS